MDCTVEKTACGSCKGDEDDDFITFEGDNSPFWADDADDQLV
jgi:hypothetical protein